MFDNLLAVDLIGDVTLPVYEVFSACALDRATKVLFSLCMKFVMNNYENCYFSEENDNQQGSVEEQLSIMKAIFIGKYTKILNTSLALQPCPLGRVFVNLFDKQVNTTVGQLNS